jgi:transposase InsO family protein
MASELDEAPQRWTAKRRSTLAPSRLKGETSAAEAARRHGLTVAQVEEWRELFLAGAENALEQACLARFGTLRPTGPTPVLRSDNGLIFQSKRFRAACREYGLSQEYITPYTPEQKASAPYYISFGTMRENSSHGTGCNRG